MREKIRKKWWISWSLLLSLLLLSLFYLAFLRETVKRKEENEGHRERPREEDGDEEKEEKSNISLSSRFIPSGLTASTVLTAGTETRKCRQHDQGQRKGSLTFPSTCRHKEMEKERDDGREKEKKGKRGRNNYLFLFIIICDPIFSSFPAVTKKPEPLIGEDCKW